MCNAQTAGFFVRFFSFLTFLGFMMLGPTAFAANQGYVGASVGQADYDILDDTDSAFKVFGGFQFTPNLAVELSYIDLGGPTVSEAGVGSATVESSGLGVALVGMHSQGGIGFLGKIGFYNFDNDITLSGPIAQAVFGVPSISASDSGTELFFGLGLTIDFSPKIGMRLEWENYDLDILDDVSLISFGLVMKF